MILLAFEIEKESLRMAFDSIKERKLRSGLTALGIIIGIAAIIALVSIGAGTNAAVSQALSTLGGNTIFVAPGGGGGGGFSASSLGGTLTQKDLNDIKSVNGVDLAVGILAKSQAVTFRDETKFISFYGVDPNDAQKFFSGLGVIQVSQGQFFKSGDRNVAVLGYSVAQKDFSDTISVNDKLTINGKSIRVVGILKETGNTQYDSVIIAPIEDVSGVSGTSNQYSIIFARVSNPSNIDNIAASIQKKMDDLHGKKTFLVFTPKQLSQQIGTVTSMISITLGGIAGIALIVAGIGIANTMFMSVIERTKEIGIMKAIGASYRNILEIFLMEAALIGLIGGAIGDALGILFSNILGVILANYGLTLTTEVTPELLGLGLAFSVGVGTLFGLLPARKAAKMNPIEALRYE